uniref:Foot protein-3 n=1 Tax=Plectus sambesii TaxID=2011161 RepID=A0A914VCF1_9BILA
MTRQCSLSPKKIFSSVVHAVIFAFLLLIIGSSLKVADAQSWGRYPYRYGGYGRNYGYNYGYNRGYYPYRYNNYGWNSWGK